MNSMSLKYDKLDKIDSISVENNTSELSIVSPAHLRESHKINKLVKSELLNTGIEKMKPFDISLDHAKSGQH
jgi:hypothetical protein